MEDTVNFSKEGRKYDDTEMDMTPMVDVTFLLLVFFMVTAAFTLQKSIQVPAPQESDQPSTNVQQKDPEEDPDYVTVEVDAFNTFRVITNEWEEEAPSVAELHVQLRRAKSASPPPSKLLIKANTEALHEKVVAALDAGTAVGMESVQLTTVEDQ